MDPIFHSRTPVVQLFSVPLFLLINRVDKTYSSTLLDQKDVSFTLSLLSDPHPRPSSSLSAPSSSSDPTTQKR